MKKYLYLLLIALCASMSFTLVSCKDDDDDKVSIGSVVGTWKVDASDFASDFWDSNIKSIGYTRFQEDGTYIVLEYYKEPGKEAEIEVEYGTWSQSGETLTLKLDGDTMKLTILSMSKTSMVVATNTGLSLTVTYEKCLDSEMDQYLP